MLSRLAYLRVKETSVFMFRSGMKGLKDSTVEKTLLSTSCGVQSLGEDLEPFVTRSWDEGSSENSCLARRWLDKCSKGRSNLEPNRWILNGFSVANNGLTHGIAVTMAFEAL